MSDTSDVLWSTGGNMSVEVSSVGLWVIEQFGDVSLNTGSNFLLDGLQLGLGGPRILDEHVLHQHYWVSVISHVLDFLS
jgi:hypothetical protein